MTEPLDLLVKTEMPGQLGRLLALMHELDHNGLKHLLDPPTADASQTTASGQKQT